MQGFLPLQRLLSMAFCGHSTTITLQVRAPAGVGAQPQCGCCGAAGQKVACRRGCAGPQSYAAGVKRHSRSRRFPGRRRPAPMAIPAEARPAHHRPSCDATQPWARLQHPWPVTGHQGSACAPAGTGGCRQQGQRHMCTGRKQRCGQRRRRRYHRPCAPIRQRPWLCSFLRAELRVNGRTPSRPARRRRSGGLRAALLQQTAGAVRSVRGVCAQQRPQLGMGNAGL